MKNAIARLTIILFVSGTILSTHASQLSVRAWIDGRSDLIIQGNNVWWHHYDFVAPGRWPDDLIPTDEPTFLNNFPWYPGWPQPGENRFCNCDSSIYNQLSPPLGSDGSPISVSIVSARGAVTIVQQPSQNNNFAAIVEFNDDPPGGAAWYEVIIFYNRSAQSCPSFVADQENAVMQNQHGSNIGRPSEAYGVGQEFMPTFSTLDTVYLWIADADPSGQNQPEVVGEVQVRIRRSDIRGTVLGISLPMGFTDGFDGIVRFEFAPPVPLTPEATCVIEPVSVAGHTIYVGLDQGPNPNYSRGRFILRGVPVSTSDMWFREGVCSVGPPTGCVPPPAGLTAWWRAEGDATDSVGNNHGTLQGSATFAAGRVGQAFSFDGNNGYVALPDNIFPYPTSGRGNTPFSFEVWFKTSSGGVIIGQQDVAPYTTPSGWSPAIFVDIDGRLRVEMFYGGDQAFVISTPINDGNFHHVVDVNDGTFETLYLDGVVAGIDRHSQIAYAANYHYQIGTGYTRNWPRGNGGWYNFKGLIDEPSLYNRALSASEVQNIFVAGRAGKCPPNAPLSITCPADMVTQNDPGQCGSVVNYPAATTTGNGVSVNCTPPPGSLFPVGATTVNCTATDGTGNEATCSFTVTVVDSGPPQVSYLVLKPSTLFSNPPRIVGQFQLQAADDCDSDPLIYVGGTKTSFVAGPFHNGDIVEVAHGPSLTPGSHPGGPPNVAAIQLIGDAQIWAVDSSGNASPKQICR